MLRTFWYAESPPLAPSTPTLQDLANAASSSSEEKPSPVKREYLTTNVRQPQQQKRARSTNMHMYAPDLMNQGTQRMLEAHRAVFSIDYDRDFLLVQLPSGRRSKTRRLPEEYALCESKESLRMLLAEHGVTDLMQLSVEFPRLFWNAAYHCGGNIERIEKEFLLIQ